MTGALDVTTLPLLLCGPLLRRVDARSVSVFVALKHPRLITLKVYQPSSTGNTLMYEGETETIPLGTFLHVAVVTARYKASSNIELKPNTEYSYDVLFDKLIGPHPSIDPTVEDLISGQQSLSSLSLLAGDTPLGYEQDALPGFALPPNDPARLNLLHGSCRKPHGGGRDMLAVVDTLLQNDRNAITRPHQLLLTGDQIYADDVSICLLESIRTNARSLMNLPTLEKIPNEGRAVGFDHDEVKPYHGRPNFMRDKTEYTSGYMDNHLIFLVEYYLMYIMAWSDVLWPRAAANSATPNAITLPTASQVIGAGETDPEEIAQLEKGRSTADDARKEALAFGESLKYVRRVLANVPSYMIFDDHEITDDWNLNNDWQYNAETHDTTRRLLRNGLIGYAIFQDWGNQPDDYVGNSGKATILESVRINLSSPASEKKALLDTTPDALDNLLAISPSSSNSSRAHWHYHIEADKHRIIVLDTRTMREHTSDKTVGSALLSEAARNMQLDSHYIRAAKTTLVISPAPVIGMPLVEEGLQKLLANSKGAAEADSEAWLGNRKSFEKLLFSLARLGKVVLLSGDVHYAYSNEVAYFRDDALLPPARIVQLCSSALKNEDSDTHKIGWVGNVFPTLGWLGFEEGLEDHLAEDLLAQMRHDIEALKELEPSSKLKELLRDENIFELYFSLVIQDRLSEPAVLPSGGWFTNTFSIVQALADSTRGTQWRYRTAFARDTRVTHERESKWLSYPGGADSNEDSARRNSSEQCRDVVGFCNLGAIGFQSNNSSDGPSSVVHRLIWSARDLDARVNSALMTTVHILPFTSPDPSTDRPEVTQ